MKKESYKKYSEAVAPKSPLLKDCVWAFLVGGLICCIGQGLLDIYGKVLELSDKLIADNNLTAMMVTHNMKDAIAHGNRLIMMHEGRIIFDVSGEEKKKLTVDALVEKFSQTSGQEFASDRALLSK